MQEWLEDDLDDEGPQDIDLEELGDDEADDTDDTDPCPTCGEEIYHDAEKCPRCGQYVTGTAEQAEGRQLWWLVLVALLGVVLAYLATR